MMAPTISLATSTRSGKSVWRPGPPPPCIVANCGLFRLLLRFCWFFGSSSSTISLLPSNSMPFNPDTALKENDRKLGGEQILDSGWTYLWAWSWFSNVIWTVCVFGSLLVTASQCSTLPYGFKSGSMSSKWACCGIPLITILAILKRRRKTIINNH
jgi:hypothetical protein